MLAGSVMVILGSWLPWLQTGLGTISGIRGAGLWTFYLGVLGLAGAIVPARWPAVVQGAICAAAAVGLTIWQLVHMFSLVGMQGWLPGPGLVLVLGGGVLCGIGAHQVWRGAPREAPAVARRR